MLPPLEGSFNVKSSRQHTHADQQDPEQQQQQQQLVSPFLLLLFFSVLFFLALFFLWVCPAFPRPICLVCLIRPWLGSGALLVSRSYQKSSIQFPLVPNYLVSLPALNPSPSLSLTRLPAGLCKFSSSPPALLPPSSVLSTTEGSCEPIEADILLRCVMENQADSHPPDRSPSHSVPNLRFPRPQGSLHVADWVSGSSPDIMASTYSADDDSSLSESSFEFVTRDADEGSQDDRADNLYDDPLYEHERLPHPDEVQAFGAMDDMSTGVPSSMATDFESEAADDDDHPLSPTYMPSHGHFFSHDLLTIPFAQSSVPRPIEFREPEDADIHIDKISVKHTIKEFSEEEAAQVLEDLGLDDGLVVDGVPRPLSATIRQTMSQRCLSTDQTFRLLYFGDETAKEEIVLKISRVITCSSADDYNESKTLRQNTEGVFNIVPVTFGSSTDVDVELMEASGFQIKVDTCLDAEEIPIQGGYFREDIVYSLTVDGGIGGKRYKSVPAGGPGGFRVQPSWILPHLVVIFCSEDDDQHSQRIQEATRAFCKRHAVPTLYISDQPAFVSPVAKRWLDCTHEHAVHLSLQSRELKAEHRFPIDLASFLNIDNRQMNQNLAYLTGLQEAPSAEDDKMEDVSSRATSVQNSAVLGHKRWESYVQEVLQRFAALRESYGQKGLQYLAALRDNERLYPLFLWALLMLLTMLSATLLTSTLPSANSPRNGHLGRVVVTNVPHNTPPAATAPITVSHISTETVRIATIETPAFGGLLSDIAHTVSAETPKSTACSVELYSPTEILIKIPVGTKESWLAKGAIDIDVFRGGILISSRLSTTDEGILVQIPFKESYGVLNVSIVTTRKPKVNETVAIDFGRPRIYEALDAAKNVFQNAAQKAGATFDEALKAIDDFAALADEQFMDTAASWWDAIQGASKTAYVYSAQVAQDTYGKLKQAVPTEATGLRLKKDAATLLEDTQRKFQDHLHRMEDVREDAQLALLRAQINSKLWWLKMQGKTEEHEDYERRARNFMVKRHVQVLKDRKLRDSTRCPRTGMSNCRCKDHASTIGRWKI